LFIVLCSACGGSGGFALNLFKWFEISFSFTAVWGHLSNFRHFSQMFGVICPTSGTFHRCLGSSVQLLALFTDVWGHPSNFWHFSRLFGVICPTSGIFLGKLGIFVVLSINFFQIGCEVTKKFILNKKGRKILRPYIYN